MSYLTQLKLQLIIIDASYEYLLLVYEILVNGKSCSLIYKSDIDICSF